MWHKANIKLTAQTKWNWSIISFLYNKPILVCIPFFSINLEREKRKKFILSARKKVFLSLMQKGFDVELESWARALLIS